jgi:hypothetical protein
MIPGALVPRRGTVPAFRAPVGAPMKCDAGWFAPVATRRRSISVIAISALG